MSSRRCPSKKLQMTTMYDNHTTLHLVTTDSCIVLKALVMATRRGKSTIMKRSPRRKALQIPSTSCSRCNGVGVASCFSSTITEIAISGLVPFWTKRNPDYGSKMKTINCRDDSLFEDRGMWTTMKKQKRCIIVAQGFYEWLKKNNGKEKIPHFTKREDGQLMCFAGLWDRVQFESKRVSRLPTAEMQRKLVAEPPSPGPQPAYNIDRALYAGCDHN